MNDLIQALEELLDALPSAAPDGAEMMAVAQRLKSAKDGARQALSRYRSSVEGVELPEAEIACAVDEFDLIQDWSKSHLAPGVHYLYTATTVRTLIAQAVERERESLLQRLDEAEKALQWRPIETAPENTEREVVVQWIDSDGAICRDLDYREDGCWMGWHNHAEHVEMIGGHGVSYTPPYTNWMPLPPAPKG
jgi:hypothetical protein